MLRPGYWCSRGPRIRTSAAPHGRRRALHRSGRASLRQRALDSSEPETAAELLGEALALWRDRPMRTSAGLTSAVPDATRLEDLRAAGPAPPPYARPAARSSRGELEALGRGAPLRRGWELLTMALYRSGRQADALAALRAVRETAGRRTRRRPWTWTARPGGGRTRPGQPRLAPVPARKSRIL